MGAPLHKVGGGEIAVALLNRTKERATIRLDLKAVGIDAARERDVWAAKTFPESRAESVGFPVASHGVVVLRVKGRSTAESPFPKRFGE